MDLPVKKFKPDVDENGRVIMNQRYIKRLCEEQGLYLTPSVNDKLYLHFKGFSKIQNLEEYVNLCTLYLENNLIRAIECLDNMKSLRFLYLHNNMIKKIENLDNLGNLVSLNLSNNQITKIENLSGLKKLETFNLNNNRLGSPDDIKGLVECPSIKDLDMSNNQITFGEQLLEIFGQMSNLACLYLKGNPLIENFPGYRKKMVCLLPSLKHMDNKQVTDEEKRIAGAWLIGGKDGMLEERMRIYNEKHNKNNENMKDRRAIDLRNEEYERVEREYQDKKKEIMGKVEALERMQSVGYRQIVIRLEKELVEVEKQYAKMEDIVSERLLKKAKKSELEQEEEEEPEIKKSEEKQESEMTEKEFREYMERKNLLWLIPQPVKKETSSSEEGKEENFEEDLNEFTKRFKFEKEFHKEFDSLMKVRAFDFKRVVDMMDRYISELSEQNFTLDMLLQDKQFKELYDMIKKIVNFLSAQNRLSIQS